MVAAQLKWFEPSFTTCPVETLLFSGSELAERKTQWFQAKKGSDFIHAGLRFYSSASIMTRSFHRIWGADLKPKEMLPGFSLTQQDQRKVRNHDCPFQFQEVTLYVSKCESLSPVSPFYPFTLRYLIRGSGCHFLIQALQQRW